MQLNITGINQFIISGIGANYAGAIFHRHSTIGRGLIGSSPDRRSTFLAFACRTIGSSSFMTR